jgi:hypothetical protein
MSQFLSCFPVACQPQHHGILAELPSRFIQKKFRIPMRALRGSGRRFLAVALFMGGCVRFVDLKVRNDE